MDEEFTMTKRFVERRSRDAAHVTVAPIDTAQYCSPRSLISEISSDVRVFMEKNEEGRMDKESDQLEPPSAGTCFETPGQQCLPSWETGRTTAADCLPVSVSSKFGETTFSLAESVVATRTGGEITRPYTVPNTMFVPPSRKPEDMKTANEENSNSTPVRRRGAPAS